MKRIFVVLGSMMVVTIAAGTEKGHAFTPKIQKSFLMASVYQQRLDAQRELTALYRFECDALQAEAERAVPHARGRIRAEIRRYELLIAESVAAELRYRRLAERYLTEFRAVRAIRISA